MFSLHMERWNYIAIGGHTGRKLCISEFLLEIFMLSPVRRNSVTSSLYKDWRT
jgi:hypothetical protein